MSQNLSDTKNIPTGTVTFLFTEIEGIIELAQDYPRELPLALEKHREILSEAIQSNGGFIFNTAGEAFSCAFEKAEDAVKAAVDVQMNLLNAKWDNAVIKVRTGIHSGNAEWQNNGYSGYLTLARCARVTSCAYAEQIIVSKSAYDLSKDKLDAPGDKQVTFRDLGERRLKDVIQPIRLYQVLCPGLRKEFPPLLTLDAYPNNLPAQLTGFVGREAEISQIRKALKSTRLLTLTGSGGSGKTRLALQIAADVVDDFVNGVWFVELASLSDPSFFHETVMKVFQLKEEPGKNPQDTLIEYLRDRKMLILFDNCEHLIEACALTTEKLLSNCPDLKILATSREALRCGGEHIHYLLPLDFPEPDSEYTSEKLIRFEAVRLFVERAKAVDSSFRLDNDNASALADICYQLDGIPLAIELAAARTKVLSVEKIHERLRDRFSLLTGGWRTSLPRQQTLKALIDWSYDLLDKKEKLLLGRLSVFRGGWSLEAAEAVCPDDKIDRAEILDLLSQLSEKSMIMHDAVSGRYGMLQTIMKYGEDRLAEHNETEKIMNNYLSYYMNFAGLMDSRLTGPEQSESLEKLETEHVNLQRSLEYSAETHDGESGTALSGALGRFWSVRGYLSEASFWFDSMLANSKNVSAPALAKAYNWAGHIKRILGDYSKAEKYFEDCMSLREKMGDRSGMADLYNSLGSIANMRGEYEQAEVLFKKSLNIKKELGDKRGIAHSLNNLGIIAMTRGNFEKASLLQKESLLLRRELHDKRGIANSLVNLGIIEANLCNFDRAYEHFHESLILKRELGDKQGTANSMCNIGAIMRDSGDPEGARKFCSESLEMMREIGDKQGIATALNAMGNIEFDRHEFDSSIKYFRESLKLRVELSDKVSIAGCLTALAELAGVSDHHGLALKLLGAVDAALKSIGAVMERPDQLKFSNTVSRLRQALGQEEFEALFEEGKNLTLEQAVELALSDIQ